MTQSYIGNYYGWRRAKLIKGKLFSINQPPRKLTQGERAICDSNLRYSSDHHGHAVPAKGCSCGYYAFYTLDQLLRDDPHLGPLLLVRGSGIIEEHEHGFRSEYQTIEHIFIKPFGITSRGAWKLRKDYGCPVSRRVWPQDIPDKKYPNIRLNENMSRCQEIPEREMLPQEPSDPEALQVINNLLDDLNSLDN